jgi:ATP-dependent DNA ligase
MKFMIPDGKSQGLYSFVELSHQAYRVYKHKIPAHIKMERHKYNLLRSNVLKSNKELNSSNYMAEEKIDGAYSAMRIGEHGSSMTGRRESVNGGSIPYTYKMPHLAIIKSKKYAGSVVIGETFHSKGASFLAGILNSLPGNAYRTQTEHGLMKFYPFDIKTLKIHGKTVKLDSYADKRKVLDELISTFDNQHIKKVRRTINNKPAFYSKIISNGGEGIVLKNVKDNQEPWYKIVATDIADLKITGYTEGTGRLKDKGIGALVLQDQSGKYKVNVGTGLSDELRFHIYQNPKEYIGKIAKVEYRKQTKQSLVAPRFQGFHISKVTPDNMAG